MGCSSFDIPISSFSEQVNLSSVSPPNTPSVSPPFSCAFPPTVPFYAAIEAPPPASSLTQVRSRRFKELGLDRRSCRFCRSMLASELLTSIAGSSRDSRLMWLGRGYLRQRFQNPPSCLSICSRLSHVPQNEWKAILAPLTFLEC